MLNSIAYQYGLLNNTKWEKGSPVLSLSANDFFKGLARQGTNIAQRKVMSCLTDYCTTMYRPIPPQPLNVKLQLWITPNHSVKPTNQGSGGRNDGRDTLLTHVNNLGLAHLYLVTNHQAPFFFLPSSCGEPRVVVRLTFLDWDKSKLRSNEPAGATDCKFCGGFEYCGVFLHGTTAR